jgi:hypothetical protein
VEAAVVADVLVAVVEHPIAPGDEEIALELWCDHHVVEHGVLGQRCTEVAHLAGGGQEALPGQVDRKLVWEPDGRRTPTEELAD